MSFKYIRNNVLLFQRFPLLLSALPVEEELKEGGMRRKKPRRTLSSYLREYRIGKTGDIKSK